MATPSNIILIPKAPAKAYNPDRPLEKNRLLFHQVRHFREAEKKLGPGQQTGVDLDSIKTEAQAAEYIRKITSLLHPAGALKAG
jgi:hypothetical protein